jgi:hypothetical protein
MVFAIDIIIMCFEKIEMEADGRQALDHRDVRRSELLLQLLLGVEEPLINLSMIENEKSSEKTEMKKISICRSCVTFGRQPRVYTLPKSYAR